MVYKQRVTLDDYLDKDSAKQSEVAAPIKTPSVYKQESVLEFMQKNMSKKRKSYPVLAVPDEAMNEGYDGMCAALGVFPAKEIDLETKEIIKKNSNFKDMFYRSTEPVYGKNNERVPANNEIDWNDV